MALTRAPLQTTTPWMTPALQPQMCMAPVGDNAFLAEQLAMGDLDAGVGVGAGGPVSSSSSSEGTSPQGSGLCGPTTPRPTLDAILRDYQVEDDVMTDWGPTGLSWATGTKKMTQTEAGLLDQLQFNQGLVGLYQFSNIKDQAYEVSGARFKENDDLGLPGAEDGHQDAFRHIYWNVMMTRQFGPEFAAAFATAHEGVPGNPADREAMDLYNNEIGRQIATCNPDATEEELQDLVMAAITNGDAVVIDGNGDLQFSDSVKVGETGEANDPAAPGLLTPPKWTESY